MNPSAHLTNIFLLEGVLPSPIPVTRFQVERTDGGTLTTRRLGDAAFALGKELNTVVQVRRGELVALGIYDERAPAPLKKGKSLFRVTPAGLEGVEPADPSWSEVVRRLASEELKRHLVYRTHQVWYRQRCFFGHTIVEDPQTGLSHCDGMQVEFVSLPNGKLAIALDLHIARLGPPLHLKDPAKRLQYLQDDPYVGGFQAEDDDDADSGVPRMARNYVLQQEGRLRRVWVDINATREAAADRIFVRVNRDEDSFPVDSCELRPVLAHNEVPAHLGDLHGTANPQKRFDRARTFARSFLQNVPLLGVELSSVSYPLSQAAASIDWLAIPALAVGEPPGLEGAPVPPPVEMHRLPEHRVQALATYGLRYRPPELRRVGIIALDGQEELAHQLMKDCNLLFERWKMNDTLQAVVLPVKISANRILSAAERLRAACDWLTHAPEGERPQVLFVYKEFNQRGQESDPLYREIHQELGGRMGIPVKPLQVRRQDNGDSAAIIVLSGLLSRAGAVLWGLAGSSDDPGLVHDLVFGLDVGGRARTSGDGNDRAGFCALAGDHRPKLWCDGTIVARERVPSRLIVEWGLAAARALRGQYRRHWLFLRDGQIPHEEWAALQALAAEARAEGLLKESQSFTAVEIRKDHPIRIFGMENRGAVQPLTGAHMWLQQAAEERILRSEAVLVTTGRPWNLKGTAEPVRAVFRSVQGEDRHVEALRDIWRLTHLTWHVPRHEISLPLPLYAADKVCQRQAEGRPLYANPC